MNHTSKKLLSILLCLVLMLSLIPAAYADDPTTADITNLMSAMDNLIVQMKKEKRNYFELMESLNNLNEYFMFSGPSNYRTISAYNAALEIYNRYRQSEAGSVIGINLTPAYEAREKLYAALGILGEAQFYKNAITGIRDLVNGTALPGSAKESLKTGAVSKLVEKLNALKTADPTADAYKFGSSYYGLAKKVAPDVVAAYNTVGQAVVGNIAENIAGNTDSSMVGGVMTQVGGIVGSFA